MHIIRYQVKSKNKNMFVPLDYAEDITHALKVGFFQSFVAVFLCLVTFVVKVRKDENENNK
jgi:hypothetical protein